MSGALPCTRHALVLGATGFIGRHLVLALEQERVAVTVAVRSGASYDRLTSWLEHHGSTLRLARLDVDFDAPRLGLQDLTSLHQVTEVYNCSGAFRFGMSNDEARRANVDGVREVVLVAAGLPALERLVHVSGYRVGGQDPAAVPWSAERRARTYRDLGAYEASKVESDAVFQAEAGAAGLAWSIVNPSSVIGVSHSGETDQYLGMADTLKELWHGTLAARPGGPSTFVPVVPVDYLARFMVKLPVDDTSRGASFWVLDERTPPLPDLLDIVGAHYTVKVPRLRIPVGLIKRLPQSLTKADPETLTFLASDRYPTGLAEQFAARHGLSMPDTESSILRWADQLAAHRFGEAEPSRLGRTFVKRAGVRTFEIGPAGAQHLILPGLPIGADTWRSVTEQLPRAKAVDLPGLGMSSGGFADWENWLDDILAAENLHHIVGHSIGGAAAVAAAARHPERISHLTLVAPFFLQEPGGMATRISPLTRYYMRHVTPAALSKRLTGSEASATVLASAIADLRRGRTASNVGRLLRKAGHAPWREDLQRRLRSFPGTVHLVVGSEDPLASWASDSVAALGSRVTTTTVDGAGHHPQLTHAADVAAAIRQMPAASPGANRPAS